MVPKLEGYPNRLVLTVRFPLVTLVPGTDVVEAVAAHTGSGGEAEVHRASRKRRHTLRQALLRPDGCRHVLDQTDYEIRPAHHAKSSHGWSMMS
jgi:hypothetical protein